MSGQLRETRGREVLKLVVVDGSLDLPSLDEGMASILYAFAGFSFPFQGGFDGGHMFGTSVVSVNSSQR